MEAVAPTTSNRRGFLIGAGALVIAAVAGGGYYFMNRDGISIDGSSEGKVSSSDLMAPGPLEDIILGKPDAPVTIVEYASMTCPHCANFSETTFPELKKRLIDTGKVRFIFREFPLDALAAAASAVARCAGKEKYMPMVEALFQQQRDWVVRTGAKEKLMAIAKQAGMTEESFNACLDNQQMIKAIEQTRDRASDKFGVQSTPTLFINGKKFSGSMPIEDLEREIAPYLKSS